MKIQSLIIYRKLVFNEGDKIMHGDSRNLLMVLKKLGIHMQENETNTSFH